MTTESALIVAEPAQLPQVSESAAILQVIERMAANPAVDVEKFERLMAMHERIQAKRAEQSFNFDLAQMQPNLPTVTNRGQIVHNGKVISTYAYFEDIVETVRPLMAANGFSLTYQVKQDGDKMAVTGILRHRDGHNEQTTLALPIDMSGAKNAVQGMGSSLTYAKRYVICALLNITTGGEDDDAQSATDFISADQKSELVALLQETGSDVPKFLKYIGANSLDEIRASDFNKARTALAQKKAKP